MESKIKFNIVEYISCVGKNFDIKKLIKNFSFYLISIFILIDISCFISFLSKKQVINLQTYLKTNAPVLSRQETQENKNILNNNELPKLKSSDRKSMGNPPKKNLIKYKYKWLNKPKILNINNNNDEDLEIQSRDEADIENNHKRKIKIFPFNDNDSSNDTSYLDESLSDTSDKRTETNQNLKTLPVGEEKLQIKTNIIIDQNQINKNGILPQIVSREQNARRKVRIHSIKNTGQQPENIPNNQTIDEKVIKNPIEIYCDILFIKQYLINLFSCPNNLEKESFIPIEMKIIRLIFIILLNIFINAILLNQNYFMDKYSYFNEKYNFSHEAEKGFKIQTNEKINYSLNNCIINTLISFIICLIVHLIIGFVFFSTKKKVDNLIEFNKITSVKIDSSVLKKIKCLFIVFFIINFLLVIIFCLFLLGFILINNNSEIDFLIPSFITFILLQIIPFISSIIISLIIYFGLKNDNKKMINIGKSFLF